MRLPLALSLTLLATPVVAESPKVVTDIPAVHSLTALVMGDLGTPTLLLNKGADPHDFQLRPSQARALAEADLVVWMGNEMTPWMERALNAHEGAELELLEYPQTLLREFGEADDHDEHGHEEHTDHDHDEDHAEHEGHDDHDDHDDHGHSHDGVDPHAWLEPANAMIWVTAIADALTEADPENAATYAENAGAALGDIAKTRSMAKARLSAAHDAPLVVFHDAYGYFATAFDLTILDSISAGDAAKPGAGHLSDLREELEHDGAVCIFAEAQHDPAYVQTLVEGTTVNVGETLDPSGSSLEPGPGLYTALIENLANSIADCVESAK